MTITNIFVINLEKDRARRQSVEQQMERLKLSFEFFPGVLGANLSKTELTECYSDRKARWNKGQSLVPAEIGCALSHIRVYREIIRRNLDYALILEDDVILDTNLPHYLTKLESLIQTNCAEVILLSPAEEAKNCRCRQTVDGGLKVVSFGKGFYTSSYVVTRYAAQSMLKELYPIGDVADCWGRLKRYRVVDIYITEPPLIVQDQSQFGSSTTLDIKKHSQLAGRWVYKSRRATTKFLDSFYGCYRRFFMPFMGIKLPEKHNNSANSL